MEQTIIKDITDYLQATTPQQYRHRPVVKCADGFTMSVQASATHYCHPRYDGAGFYTEVEVGFPSAKEDLLMPYAEDSETPTETVYGYVPISIIDEVIAKHGGFALGSQQ